jgi:hypothetical protein
MASSMVENDGGKSVSIDCADDRGMNVGAVSQTVSVVGVD